MENLSHALYMAAAMLAFVVAFTAALILVNKLNAVAGAVVYNLDGPYYDSFSLQHLIEDNEEVVLCTKNQNAINVKCKSGKLNIEELEKNKDKPNYVLKKVNSLELLRYIKFVDDYGDMQDSDIEDETNKLLEKLYGKHFDLLVNEKLNKKALDNEFYIGVKLKD